MSETPPEGGGPTLADLEAAFRKATVEGMKDYDRERAEWEAAEAAANPPKTEDSDPPKKGGGIGSWLLGGGSSK